MRKTILLVIACALLSSCGKEAPPEQTVKVYKSSGSVQCGGGDITPPETMRKELIDAGIDVKSFTCGNDGLIHPAMCGESDGGINVFEIPQSKASQAEALGFKALSTLPNARVTQCQ